MWETTIGKAIARHFTATEDDHFLRLDCQRCDTAMLMTAQTPLIYVLGEAVHHLQRAHGFPGAAGGWQGYLDALPAPQNPS